MPSEKSMEKAREVIAAIEVVNDNAHGAATAWCPDAALTFIATALDAAKAEREDRAQELPDFLDAILNEWGCEDTSEVAREILAFLASPVGLEEYAGNSRPTLTLIPKGKANAEG